jgi:flagellar biogenesis protein FliO
MWEALFGTDMPLPIKFVVAFVLVLVLIGGAAYLVRRFGATALNAAAGVRGRQPRLAVIDAASVDGRRRLVLIRRDNVEHLIMIGGPSDVVIEPNIVRAIPAAPVREAPVREAPPARVTETLPRAVPLAEGGGMWPLQPEPPLRPQRATPPPPPPPPAAEEEEEEEEQEQEAEADWSPPPEPAPPPEPPPRPEPARAPRMQNTDRLAGLAADLSRNFMDTEIAPPPRRAVEPRRSAPAPAPLQPVSDTDEQNLAEMAHRLETALHRPRQGGEPAPAMAPPAPRMADPPRVDPPRAEPKPAARVEPPPLPAPAARPAPKPKAGFDNLEQEMASLLGRPSGKI